MSALQAWQRSAQGIWRTPDTFQVSDFCRFVWFSFFLFFRRTQRDCEPSIFQCKVENWVKITNPASFLASCSLPSPSQKVVALDFWLSCSRYNFIYFYVATIAIVIAHILDSGIWETIRQEKEGDDQLLKKRAGVYTQWCAPWVIRCDGEKKAEKACNTSVGVLRKYYGVFFKFVRVRQCLISSMIRVFLYSCFCPLPGSLIIE